MLQKLIYSIFIFLSSKFSNFYVFYFHNYFWTNLLWYYGIENYVKKYVCQLRPFHHGHKTKKSFKTRSNATLGASNLSDALTHVTVTTNKTIINTRMQGFRGL
jgi:hypothetical protein